MSTHNICFHGELRKKNQYLLDGKTGLPCALILNSVFFSVKFQVCIKFQCAPQTLSSIH